MKERAKKHVFYYISLLAVIVLGVILALQYPYSKQTQMLIVVMTTFFYVSLGILHHRENHDLTAKIVVEYTLVGGLGMTIVSFFLLGSS